jgi:hypothetical protein
MGALRVERVGRHGDPGQVVGLQECGEAGDFVGLVGDAQLGDGPAVAGHCCQEMSGGRAAVPGAAGGLAVHRHAVRAGGVGAGQIGEAAWAGQADDPADRGGARSDPYAESSGQSGSQPGQGVLRGVRGPLPHGRERLRAGDDRRGGDQQHRHERVTDPSTSTRIGQDPQPLNQRTSRHAVQDGRLDQADGVRLAAHRSSGGSRRLGGHLVQPEFRCVRDGPVPPPCLT